MRLGGQLVQREDLTGQQRDQMFALMTAYYSNMRREDFDVDLDEKQWVILLTAPRSQTVRGFSTQTTLDVTVQGRSVRALFSGDTIVHHEFWARNPLARLWGQFALSLIDTTHEHALYWFLISKGYKTYRFLPVFFHEFYPRFDAATPEHFRELLDAFGKAKFPTSYDPARQIVRTDHEGCHLRPDVAEIDEQRLTDPHISFFAERNPGHAGGDELCCIAPLTRNNFTKAAYRVIGSAAREPIVS